MTFSQDDDHCIHHGLTCVYCKSPEGERMPQGYVLCATCVSRFTEGAPKQSTSAVVHDCLQCFAAKASAPLTICSACDDENAWADKRQRERELYGHDY